jgi:hypothetical protein
VVGASARTVRAIGEPFDGRTGPGLRFDIRTGAACWGRRQGTLRIDAAPVDVLRRIVEASEPGAEWHDNAARLLAEAGEA